MHFPITPQKYDKSRLNWSFINQRRWPIKNPGAPKWGHPTIFFTRFYFQIFLLLLFWDSKLNLRSCDRTLPFWGMYDRMRVYPKNALAASFHTCTPQPPRLKLCQSCWKARCFWSVQAMYTKNSWKDYTKHVRTLPWLIVDWKEREKKNQSELSDSATQVTSNLSNHHQKESITKTVYFPFVVPLYNRTTERWNFDLLIFFQQITIQSSSQDCFH